MYKEFCSTMEVVPTSEHKYNLRWPDYHNSVLASFRSLKEEEDFIDVTLSCEESQYTAHKVVLSACSPYFRKLLKSNPCQHPIIILRDVREEDLRLLLNFMYAGEVQVEQDRLNSFLRTAEMLQIKGLLDHPLKEQCQKTSSTSLSSNKPHNEQGEADDYSPMAKRSRTGPISPSLLPCRDSSNELPRHNGDRDPWARPMSPRMDHVESSSHKYEHTNGDNKSLLSQALEKNEPREEKYDRDSVSDDDRDSDERAGSASIDTVKSDMNSRDCEPPTTPIFPPGLEALYRQAGFPPFLGLGQHPGAGGLAGPSVTHVGLQSHAANPTDLISVGGMLSDMHPVNVGGKLEMMRVRATDPRPCPKCGKIYRSAHTLRTHMEDKHTICPGYRCVLCGTVAKSRNSLHSHMSRQHRGISTKDLPVVPMPAPFDPELASKLLSKAGVKVSPTELAARASPTAPRRSDLPKLDNNLAMHNQNQFPLPPSLPPAHLNLSNHRDRDRDKDSHDDPEDLRVPMSSPLSSPNFSSSHYSSHSTHPIASLAAAQGMKPPLGLGNSALLNTYISMIAAAGGDVSAATQAALNFQNGAGMMGMGMPPFNGKDDRYGSDREDEGELGSDAENDDMSDTEDIPTSTERVAGGGVPPPQMAAVPINNGDH